MVFKTRFSMIQSEQAVHYVTPCTTVPPSALYIALFTNEELLFHKHTSPILKFSWKTVWKCGVLKVANGNVKKM